MTVEITRPTEGEMLGTRDGGLNLRAASDDGAEAIVSNMTAEWRKQFLHSACMVLPAHHPVGSRADRVLRSLDQPGQDGVDDSLDQEVRDTTLAAWRAVEAQREANRRELAQIIEAFRDASIDKMEGHLSQANLCAADLDDLRKEFENGHREHPDLYALLDLRSAPVLRGEGSLVYRELSNRAARGAPDKADDAWKKWLDILLGYLLKNDHGNEHIQKFPHAARVCPAGADSKTHPGEALHDEVYEIRRLFKASALCCSWLRHHKCKPEQSSQTSRKAPAATIETPSGVRGLSDANVAKVPAAQAQNASTDVNPLQQAMLLKDLNVPQLTKKVRNELKLKGTPRPKLDRTTIYRIIQGRTKNPQPLVLKALLGILNVSEEERRRFIRTRATSSCTENFWKS